MPRRKRKGIELDSTSSRQSKQFSVHKHGKRGTESFKGKDKKEKSGRNKGGGGGGGSAHLLNKPTVSAARNQRGDCSGNWRALVKQLEMEQSRKRDQGRTSTEYGQTKKTHKEPCGSGVVAIVTSSKGQQQQQQQLQRREVEAALRKKQTSHSLREKARGMSVQSVNSGVRGRHSNGKSRQRQFQESRKEKDAMLKSSHFKMDFSESCKRPGKQVIEECMKGLETQSEEKKEHRLWFRRPKTSSGRSTGVWHTKPGRLREKNFEHETTRKKKTFKRKDIWFDDVDIEMVEGEPVPKKPRLEQTRTSLITGGDKSAGKCLALDCEMVGTGPTGDFSMLARCSLVNHHGNTLYDKYVAPMDVITDYRTEYSGIRPRDLEGAPDFKTVQREVSDLIRGRILVGHGLHHDLKALLLSHPKKDIRDTSKYKPFRKLASKGGTPSLKKLAAQILGIEIQEKEHNSVEDARVAMRLYQLYKKEWEDAVKARVGRRERERSRHMKPVDRTHNQVQCSSGTNFYIMLTGDE